MQLFLRLVLRHMVDAERIKKSIGMYYTRLSDLMEINHIHKGKESNVKLTVGLLNKDIIRGEIVMLNETVWLILP